MMAVGGFSFINNDDSCTQSNFMFLKFYVKTGHVVTSLTTAMQWMHGGGKKEAAAIRTQISQNSTKYKFVH